MSLRAQDFPCSLGIESSTCWRMNCRWVEDNQAGRTVLSLTSACQHVDIPKNPLISSDYAVIAGLRLGGSQEELPTLLLGCLPGRHLELRYYNETFVDCFVTFCQEHHFYRVLLDELAKPKFLKCLSFCLRSAFCVSSVIFSWVSHNLFMLHLVKDCIFYCLVLKH